MSGPGSQAEVRTIGDGRYALLEEVGRGGMGVVWHGEDRLIQRPVAIKEISVPRNLTAQDRDSSIRRLLREIRGAGRINDPAAVTVHDVLWDSDAGVVHIVMEFVEGSSLAEVLDRFGPMRPEWAAAIALDALRQDVSTLAFRPEDEQAVAVPALQAVDQLLSGRSTAKVPDIQSAGAPATELLASSLVENALHARSAIDRTLGNQQPWKRYTINFVRTERLRIR